MINEIEKKFVKMMIPVCADIIENKRVDISEVLLKQNVFMYAVTGDFFFVQKIEESKQQNQINQIRDYIERIKTVQFHDVPQAIGMAQVWWDGVFQIFKDVYPNVLGESCN